jgi:hypothetical protein
MTTDNASRAERTGSTSHRHGYAAQMKDETIRRLGGLRAKTPAKERPLRLTPDGSASTMTGNSLHGRTPCRTDGTEGPARGRGWWDALLGFRQSRQTANETANERARAELGFRRVRQAIDETDETADERRQVRHSLTGNGKPPTTSQRRLFRPNYTIPTSPTAIIKVKALTRLY